MKQKESKDQQAGAAPEAKQVKLVAEPEEKPEKKVESEEKAPKPAMLTVETVSKAQDIKEQELELKEWEGSLIVRGMSSIVHEQLTSSCTEGPIGNRQFNMVGYQAKVAILCSYDGFAKDGGKPIFEKKHLTMLMEKASGPVAAIANLAHELSGIGKDAVKKALENLEKTPSAGSRSDWPKS